MADDDDFSPIYYLPREMKFEIMLMVDVQTLQNMCNVAHEYADICAMDDFWVARYKQDYGSDVKLDENLSWKQNWILRTTMKTLILTLNLQLDIFEVEGESTTMFQDVFTPTEAERREAETVLKEILPEIMKDYDIHKFSLIRDPDNAQNFLLDIYTLKDINMAELLSTISGDTFDVMNNDLPTEHRNQSDLYASHNWRLGDNINELRTRDEIQAEFENGDHDEIFEEFLEREYTEMVISYQLNIKA